MANTADARKALARQKEQSVNTLAKLINDMRPEIARALPKHMDPDRMARIATTLLRTTPQLALVTPQSFLGALMTCTQLGLEPGPLGHVWIIPRADKNTGALEANFQLGYKGVIELARRSGKLAKITARTVYANEVDQELFTVSYDGADEHISHKPILIGERGKPVLYYAIAKLVSSEQAWAPLTPDEVETRHRRRPQAAPNSPAWTNDYQSMAWKSCVVELRRWLPQSPELEQALAQDGRVRTDLAPEVLETPAVDLDMIDGEAEEITVETEEPAKKGGRRGGQEEAEAAPVEDWPATAQPPDTPRGDS